MSHQKEIQPDLREAGEMTAEQIAAEFAEIQRGNRRLDKVRDLPPVKRLASLSRAAGTLRRSVELDMRRHELLTELADAIEAPTVQQRRSWLEKIISRHEHYLWISSIPAGRRGHV